MPLINFAAREINYKIVYYGCGLCGKTTNIQYIHRTINPEARGKLVSIATEEERTLYFDFLPLTLGTVKGMQTRFHLYTVPGQSYYNASRKLVLQGVDGVIFVADSQITRLDENVESYLNLWDNLLAQGDDLTKLGLRHPDEQARPHRRVLGRGPQRAPQPHRLAGHRVERRHRRGRLRHAQDRLQAGHRQDRLSRAPSRPPSPPPELERALARRQVPVPMRLIQSRGS